MVFNAKKCYMMHIDRSTSQPVHFYTLCGTVLSAVANEKYLGVYIQQDLKWTLQVDQVRAAASRKLGFLRRNLRGAPRECKKLAYISLVRSSMEYACTIWDPHYSGESLKLERIQKRAARWIYSKYSRDVKSDDLVADLKWQTLEERRRALRLALLYKINKEDIAVPMKEVDLVFSSRPIRYTKANRRKNIDSKNTVANKQKLNKCGWSTDEYRYSYSLRTATQWNELPNSTVEADSEALFRSLLLPSSP